MKKYLVATHSEDVDGIVSAGLVGLSLFIHERTKPDYMLVQYSEQEKKFQELYELCKRKEYSC